MELEDVCATAGRDAAELTRRDVARALLTVPARDALASLPALRRELLAVGLPGSARFWEATTRLLTAVREGTATLGDVRTWLEATGTEPTSLVAGGFGWPDEDERGPIARGLHGRLVAHLEKVVAAGGIDPDGLLDGVEEAMAAYEQVQIDWLYAPLADGRQPIWAVSDEEDEELLVAWGDAEADAREILAESLEQLGPRPCPTAELHVVAARLRLQLRDGGWPYDLLRAVGGVEREPLPDDERELWLRLASTVVTGGGVDPTGDLIDHNSHVAWMMLEHADWIGAVATLARLGVSADADAAALARYAATFDFEADLDDPDATVDVDVDHLGVLEPDEMLLVDGDGYDVELALSIGFHTVVRLWRLIGAVDEDERLTDLGWWGLPEALDRAWRPRLQGL